MRLVGGSLGLGTEVGGGTALAEEAADQRLEERVEDHLGTAVLGQSFASHFGIEGIFLPSLGKSHPEDQDELEDVVEGWGLRLARNLVRNKEAYFHLRNQ